jgi:Family of unknown function (DUF6174)
MRFAALVIGLAVAVSATAQSGDLERARQRWAAAGVVSYEYGYHKFCECHGDTPPETLVTVTAGVVTNVRHRPAGSETEIPAAQRNFGYYWTIDGLLDLAESALARDAVVRIRFDDALGYPTSVYIDYDTNLIGDELDVRITQLRVL